MRYRMAISIAGLAGLVACGGGDSRVELEVPPPPPPPGSLELAVERVFPSLSFSQPVALLQAPGEPGRWYVVERAGRILSFENNASVSVTSTFLDIRNRVDASGQEMGLLGMAFHPAFPTDPRVFVCYTNSSAGRISRVSSFSLAAGGQSLNANSEQILLTVSQPEANHNGGGIAFGPEGGNHLYIGFGDGGGANDQHGQTGNGQRLTTLLGKMLRIEILAPGADPGYRIPADNPFAGNPLCNAGGNGSTNCPEIYAWGLRNPWRWSFDRQSAELWVADVGQSEREEVNRVERSGNYGWRCFEGTRNTGLNCGSPQEPLQPPIAEYGRSLGRSITGGYVYRGSAIADLRGRYVFGDFVSGRLWHIPANTAPTLTMTGGLQTGLGIASFGEANDGELYVVDYGGGLYRLKAD